MLFLLRYLASRKSQRGQNMVEYSALNWVMAMGLMMGATVKMIPGPKEAFAGGRMNILEAFLFAFQTYLDSFTYVLNNPFP